MKNNKEIPVLITREKLNIALIVSGISKKQLGKYLKIYPSAVVHILSRPTTKRSQKYLNIIWEYIKPEYLKNKPKFKDLP